jgi:hypothetical protein
VNIQELVGWLDTPGFTFDILGVTSEGSHYKLTSS